MKRFRSYLVIPIGVTIGVAVYGMILQFAPMSHPILFATWAAVTAAWLSWVVIHSKD